MDSSFSNPSAPHGKSGPANAAGPSASPAEERFQSCRWCKPAENGSPAYCSHRDVLPMAGTAGFQPESWCLECTLYKAKRSPRKRPQDQPQDDWRW